MHVRSKRIASEKVRRESEKYRGVFVGVRNARCDDFNAVSVPPLHVFHYPFFFFFFFSFPPVPVHVHVFFLILAITTDIDVRREIVRKREREREKVREKKHREPMKTKRSIIFTTCIILYAFNFVFINIFYFSRHTRFPYFCLVSIPDFSFSAVHSHACAPLLASARNFTR